MCVGMCKHHLVHRENSVITSLISTEDTVGREVLLWRFTYTENAEVSLHAQKS